LKFPDRELRNPSSTKQIATNTPAGVLNRRATNPRGNTPPPPIAIPSASPGQAASLLTTPSKAAAGPGAPRPTQSQPDSLKFASHVVAVVDLSSACCLLPRCPAPSNTARQLT
jgi:hypothetical protein